MSIMNHVIWDWNGTLLDDFEITAQITIDALGDLGAAGVELHAIRHHYERPLSNYFSALLGRTATAKDIEYLSTRYDTRYNAAMYELPLAADAIQAMDLIARTASQSLLSMAPDGQLQMLVDHHGLRKRFAVVKGSGSSGHPTKQDSLAAHCAALKLKSHQTWLIGDTVDDQVSARAVGIHCILVATGMQSKEKLEATGAPVAANLLDAARLFVSMATDRAVTQ